jgi:pimeloyl-ACP methyl ester carboxylesterase
VQQASTLVGHSMGSLIALEAAARRTRSHLVLARRDRMTLPKAATEVGRRLGAETQLLDLPGHDLMQEDPEGLLRALRAALGR